MQSFIKFLQTLTGDKVPNINVTSSQLINDSRKIVPNCVFVAEQGVSRHALDYLTLSDCEKVDLVIYEPTYKNIDKFAKYSEKFISVKLLALYLGDLASYFSQYHFELPIIGVTGTNGKTSITHFISELSQYHYGVLGTNGYGDPKALTCLDNTTPNAIATHDILCELSTQYQGVAMEVSSHALSLDRAISVPFEVAIFSNLSQDHLDFHNDMKDYYQAKQKLFDYPNVNVSIINIDDDMGYRLALYCQKKNQRIIAIGQSDNVLEFNEYIQIKAMNLSHSGIHAEIVIRIQNVEESYFLRMKIWGAFNVFNVLSAIVALHVVEKKSLNSLFLAAQLINGVKGRVEAIALGDEKTAIVDYAHTPDALSSTLKSIREHLSVEDDLVNTAKIYTVFGCGGDRDASKRPLMAKAANDDSDFVIVTDDNPRTENAKQIIDDILSADIDLARFKTITPREQAIIAGLNLLNQKDVLLIAGKGHENYQIIGTKKSFFCDKKIVISWLDKK